LRVGSCRIVFQRGGVRPGHDRHLLERRIGGLMGDSHLGGFYTDNSRRGQTGADEKTHHK
jgi:hypothetical protein